MQTLAKKVYGLWSDLEEMASDLGESVNALRRAHDAGHLPDARHDRVIIVRARALGKKLTLSDLTVNRSIRPDVVLYDRRKFIRDWIEKAGGYQAVHEATGVSRAHLYANVTRGFLNRTARHEYLQLAEAIGEPLPDEIFNRPPG